MADGRYQVLRVIGRGGFGITYDVGDRRLRRRVAMKELFPDSAVRHGSRVLTPPRDRAGFQAARERFMREARVLARFTHPGIVRVYEVFEEHGTAYLVMELLEGRTLVELLRERGRPFSEAEVLDVAGRVAAALRPVHAAGVLHRDVNPSNVMMTHHGRIVVIDFGLARDYDQEQTAGMTRVVTPGYAPLEQYRGEGRFGPATDVYGLAATCYRLATGRVPVSAVDRDAGKPLPSPRDHNPELSRDLSDAILDGLELDPAHRPADLDSFLARLGLRALPDGPRSVLLDAAPPPPSHRPRSADDLPAGAVGASFAPMNVAKGVGQIGAAAGTALASAGADRVAAAARTGVPDDAWVPGPEVGAAPGAEVAEPAVALDPPTTATEMVAARWEGPAPTMAAPVGSTVPAPSAHEPGPARPPAPAPEPAPGSDLTRPVSPGGDPVGPRLVVPAPAGYPAEAPMVAEAAVGPSDGYDQRLPLAVGPHPHGRRRFTVPAMAATLALASAAPVLATVAAVGLGLPALATVGDSVAHRLRATHGIAGGWAERRMAPGALAPARFVRNLLASVLRASPMLGVGSVLLAGWYGLEALDAPNVVLDWSLRGIGLLVVGVVVGTAREGSVRFRTGLGIDNLVERLVPNGRTTERTVVLWIVAAFVVAGGLWLTPDPFPLP